jgi:hypothetical protein
VQLKSYIFQQKPKQTTATIDPVLIKMCWRPTSIYSYYRNLECKKLLLPRNSYPQEWLHPQTYFHLYVVKYTNAESGDSVVAIVIVYGLDDWEVGVRIQVGYTISLVLHIVQTGSGGHPGSYLMVTGSSFPGGKPSEALSWPFTSI